MTYEEFIASKQITAKPSGFEVARDEIGSMLFDWQRDIVRWALRLGKAAVFAGCGLGKTAQQLEWGKHVCQHTGGRVLILAPLAVSNQTKREAEKFEIDVPVAVCKSQATVPDFGITITNYQKLQHFDPTAFDGIVIDESSCLKHESSKYREYITASFSHTPFRLACTATPAPNDHMELGNHAEFLGVMTRAEMLSMFFTHDGGDTSKWRLRGHAQDEFWRFVASWAVMLEKPSDLGYSDEGFELQPLNYHNHVVEAKAPQPGYLFAVEANTLAERRQAKRDSIDERVELTARLIKERGGRWLVWCLLNDESDALTRAITRSVKGAVEVRGSDSDSHKERSMLGFANGDIEVLVSKSSICGFGMNFQSCHQMAFVGLSDSFEAMFQAVRRCWRFGQTEPVDAHIVTSELEGNIVRNVQRKEADFRKMLNGMVRNMAGIAITNLLGTQRHRASYDERHIRLPAWVKNNGTNAIAGVAENSGFGTCETGVAGLQDVEGSLPLSSLHLWVGRSENPAY